MRGDFYGFHSFFWSFAATVVLTTIMSASRGLGLTRMDIPFMLGTIFTPDRDRAKWVGFLFHLVNGWIFSLLYLTAFATSGFRGILFGALVGLAHASFALTVGMALLPSLHPRMATELEGPDPTRILEPPGFMALHYGSGTPVATILAHLIYGAMLGFFA